MRSRIVASSRSLVQIFSNHLGDGSGPCFPEKAGFPIWIQRRNALSPAAQQSREKLRPLQRYEWMVKQGMLQQDDDQHRVAGMLDSLLLQMKDYQKTMVTYQAVLRKWSEEREKIKKELLKEQSVVEAQKIVQQISNQNQSGIFAWWSRKIRHSRAEAGAGKMVARLKREKKLSSLVGPPPSLPPAPQGLYLYGNVGCGKTLLMDMFFNASEGVVKHRRRVHFHAAMLEVHDRMHKLWKQQKENRHGKENDETASKKSSPTKSLTLEMAAKQWLEQEEQWEKDQQSELGVLTAVADEFFAEGFLDGASLLCFDEVQVMDVFTAVALAAILSRLLSKGTVIVATSNRAPRDLNKDGMQKELFEAFLSKLEQHCQSVLVGLDKDYRRVLASMHNLKEEQAHYFWPLGSESQQKLEEQWLELVSPSDERTPISSTLPVMFGRTLEVPESYHGVARFSFQELCNRPLGAADYVSLAQNYHTVFVTNIPVMSMRIRDQARRFITLIDELYNHHCRLICTASAPVDELFLGTEEGPLIDLESLQFETEAEGSRLRRDVLVSGNVAPLAGTNEERSSIQSLLSGREELFAFRRAVSRLIEMQTPIYLESLHCHPKFSSSGTQAVKQVAEGRLLEDLKKAEGNLGKLAVEFTVFDMFIVHFRINGFRKTKFYWVAQIRVK
ncbi:hypothetical protein R1flu_004508 [Riccia fluitans]|uniref:AFG1-like ATPase n=1 Tax=Riccia fluitans TaxID=41844 RepID=A0ABD1YRG8_9MARC